MKLLLIEDDPTWVSSITAKLATYPALSVSLARSRDSALTLLQTSSFDMIVCDLKIPTSDDQLDAETEHGEAVIAAVRERHPGTPLMILSAFGTIEFAVGSVENAERVDIVGDGVIESLTVYRRKIAIDSALAEIARFMARLRQTDDIEIRRQGAGNELTPEEGRLIRILARRCEGRVIDVDRMPGGLSDTSTFRVRVAGGDGQLRALAFVKVGRLHKMEEERRREQQHVGLMLPVGAFAALTHQVDGGAGAFGANFYQLTEGATSLTQALRTTPSITPQIVIALADNCQSWHSGGQVRELTIRQIRELLGAPNPSALGARLADIDCSDLEERTAIVRSAVQHGDLHVENVLVVPTERPVIIDFGEVGNSVAAYDAVTLELSMLFHPSASQIRGSWPTTDQVRQWHDLDAYTANSPVAEAVHACRSWALSVSPSDRGVYACAYAYAIRQLTYNDTNKDWARALIECVVAELR